MLKKYTFRFSDLVVITVVAETEHLARREAMIAKYGELPDSVTPHAPAYAGRGLSLVSIKS